MYIARNIDVVQFDLVKGKTDYYFPKNVSWANRKVNKMIVDIGVGLTSPINGDNLVNSIPNMYLDLYDKDNKQIVNKASIEQILYLNDNPLYVNNYISLELSKLWIPSVTESGSILVYVFFDGEEKDCEELPAINKSITVQCTLPSKGKISFQDLVDNYITLQPNKVKGIISSFESDNVDANAYGGFITLRDKTNKRVFNHISTELCRDNVYNLYYTQRNTFRFVPMDIDMLNSYITNRTAETITYNITFLY